jgi:hypothetical protein
VEVRLPGLVTKADAKVGPSIGGAFNAAAAARPTDAASEDDCWYDPVPVSLARLSSRSSASTASTLASVYWDCVDAGASSAGDGHCGASNCTTPRTPAFALASALSTSWAGEAPGCGCAGEPRARLSGAQAGAAKAEECSASGRGLETGADPLSLPTTPTGAAAAAAAAAAADRLGAAAVSAAQASTVRSGRPALGLGHAPLRSSVSVVEAPVEYVLRRYKQVRRVAPGHGRA